MGIRHLTLPWTFPFGYHLQFQVVERFVLDRFYDCRYGIVFCYFPR